jgi:soluble lytic murein transglycosylase-like protein
MSCLRKLVVVLVVAMALPAFAAEVAVLRNGFSIQHERRQVMGTVTRLFVNADGSSYVDVATSDIEHFEKAPREQASSGTDLRVTHSSDSPTSNLSGAKPDLDQVVAEASGRYRLDPDLVNSVIKAESGFNVRAVSRKGAQGLMQLMPGTASQLGVPDAFDAQANVEGGTKYLRELLERYDFDLIKALAAYNAGTRRVEQYGGVPPYYETRAYVARIVRDFNKKKIAAAAAKKSAAVKKTDSKVHGAAVTHGSSAQIQASE